MKWYETLALCAAQILVMSIAIGCVTLNQLKNKIPDIRPPTTTTTTTSTTTTTQPHAPEVATCGCTVQKAIEVPAELAGGECIKPGGLDIRVGCNLEQLNNGRKFKFIGDICKPHIKYEKQADGMWKISMSCFDHKGYRVHVVGHQLHSSADKIIPGNVGLWDKDRTFRFQCIMWRIEK